ncbi:PDZ domain-containing protein [Tuwongella immobilis]|uniref:PDZ domain-containing protein n=1 Tax=Tuwongella immobilis TaxID=692036 RepID=A0A6C2YRV4_9BACT|nr:PDZ domain-containing protein [Tuwongella immobilis]VIP03889.1 protease do : Serine protease, trypsin family OS=uncultured planctomycete GN=HGMM_F01A04C13 PE=4 SV=1: Trypsin_2: PDZ_2: PDZ_2 [Tuwongella immobilis]VTS05145.1 protease do : Serine protease, trypsin family OS=uncultured planctomycete GN=HGMM_F01A04C13 PE=4 SV=1: Trypsin_2: PDZ_2: PDZ_2 [Tuwongella immobilis]
MMNRGRIVTWGVCLLALTMPTWFPTSAMAQPMADALNDANETVIKSAVMIAAPSVVKIETSGGAEVIGSGRSMIRKGIGPTTGLIVDADGFIITSAFNFVNKPTDIIVTIPGKGRHVAKVVATDRTRLLTLLKVEVKGLPVPKAIPLKEIQIGQWSIALGRTLDPNVDHPPSQSVGIISALGRIWGKAIQTDAKVSPVNYGGPIIGVDGRVQGVLVPASPQGEGETAGVEWYDSGIGFAIPLDDVFRVLPRLKTGKDLRAGLLGISQAAGNQYADLPKIGLVTPGSAAEKAGIQPGDLILSVDGKPVVNQAQVLHQLRPKYEGDVVSVKVKRGDKELDFPQIPLAGSLQVQPTPYLGILPMRDDPEPGVGIRQVLPKSPAEQAGLKMGDRILKIAPATAMQLRGFNGRDQFSQLVSTLPAGLEVKLEVKRAESKKTETITLRLGAMTDELPAKLEENSTAKKALEKPKPAPQPMGGPRPPMPMPMPMPMKDEPKEDAKKPAAKPETGLIRRNDPVVDRSYWMYVPPTYDPNISYGLVVWLHIPGQGGKDADTVLNVWDQICQKYHLIMVAPLSKNADGWLGSEMDDILATVQEVRKQYTIDPERVIAHGMGGGGQMAFYLGFNAREQFRGVAAIGAVPSSPPKDNLPGRRLSIFLTVGEKDPLRPEVLEAKPKLLEKQLPLLFRELPGMGKEYVDAPTFDELIRWIDSLDRI